MSDLPPELQARIAEIKDTVPSGPNQMAEICGVMIPYLLAKREAATDKRERKEWSRRLKINRQLRSFAVTRVGYAKPVKKSAANLRGAEG